MKYFALKYLKKFRGNLEIFQDPFIEIFHEIFNFHYTVSCFFLLWNMKYIRKEQEKTMNRDERSYQLSHVYDKLFAAANVSHFVPKKAAAVAETSAIIIQ